MFGLFGSKKKVEEIREETKKGFESVKKDILSASEWIKHLDSEKKLGKKEIIKLKESLSSVKEEIEELKELVYTAVNLNTNSRSNRLFKTTKALSNKQTAVYPVQTAVQTAVQTPKLSNFSITERAILFVLLNSDMKLSYDDLATMLNKEKSTIRGQINSIKSKSESLLQEIIEKNGKKRVYILEKDKEKLLKKRKVSVRERKSSEKKEEQEKD